MYNSERERVSFVLLGDAMQAKAAVSDLPSVV